MPILDATGFFALRIGDGTVFIGPTATLSAASETWPEDFRTYRGDLAAALRASADFPRLRAVADAWGLRRSTTFRNDVQLCSDIAEAVARRQLAALFLPLFIDDRRGPAGGAEAPFRRYQLEGGAQMQVSGVSSSPRAPTRSPPPPPRTNPGKPETDFPDEAAQAQTLKEAARSGAPFCEICAAQAKSAA